MQTETQTMKAAVLRDVRDLQVVDTARPEPGDDGVLVRVRTVGICGTDLHTYKLGLFREMSLPVADGALFGHEFSGDIAAIGSGGNYALAAGRALIDTSADAETIARRAMTIAADICVYTNHNIVVEKI